MVTGDVVPASASVQVLPLFVVYWYLEMDEPPSEPAVKAIDAVVFPGVATREVGAEAVVAGVKEEEATEAAPEPAAFTARSFTV